LNEDYVLDGIDLKIPYGEITAIIGFSGAGKSVFLKLILGLLKPTSGSIQFLPK
jgi:ABC-type transporter Mla maintaining outer membrane lipid asymmetry ATPase subunit MlaF